jgi:hypothetical protein
MLVGAKDKPGERRTKRAFPIEYDDRAIIRERWNRWVVSVT